MEGRASVSAQVPAALTGELIKGTIGTRALFAANLTVFGE